MARPRVYRVYLTDEEYEKLNKVKKQKKTSRMIRSRCQIILDLDENHGKAYTREQAAKTNGVCITTVTNTIRKYVDGGVEAVLEYKRNINSDNARRKVDGRAEARIIELACGPVPEGHTRWTLRLLAEEAKAVLETSVGKDAIHRTLKKRNSAPQK